MNTSIKIITIIFSIMCLENIFRAADWMMEWTEPIVEQVRPKDLDFSSEYEVPDNPAKNTKYLGRMESGPGLLCQTLFCMLLMIINNLIWVRRSTFSSNRHTLHYFVASAILILYLPRRDWFPAMAGPKYCYTAMNLFIFQVTLGQVASLTATHQFLVLFITVNDLVLNTKDWF